MRGKNVVKAMAVSVISVVDASVAYTETLLSEEKILKVAKTYISNTCKVDC